MYKYENLNNLTGRKTFSKFQPKLWALKKIYSKLLQMFETMFKSTTVPSRHCLPPDSYDKNFKKRNYLEIFELLVVMLVDNFPKFPKNPKT